MTEIKIYQIYYDTNYKLVDLFQNDTLVTS